MAADGVEDLQVAPSWGYGAHARVMASALALRILADLRASL